MSDSNEVEFLRHQVDELTNLLHDYQAKYPPLTEADRTSLKTFITPPWHLDQRLISPILIEYQATLGCLNEELEKYKAQYKSVQKQVDQLVSENDRLTNELENTIQEKLTPLDSVGCQPGLELSDNGALDNLQSQLRCIMQEKDAMNDLLRASQREARRLEEELSELRMTKISDSHWQNLLEQHQQMKVKFTQTLSDMNQELRVAQEDARRHKRETELAEQKLQDFKRSMSQNKDKLLLQDKGRVIQAEENTRQLEIQLEAKSTECSELQSDLDQLHELVDQQLDQIQRLTACCTSKERDLQDAANRIKEAVETAEEAVLEKTEMSLSIKNYQSEIDRLREELTVLCDQAGKKTKEEVDKVQAYNDIKIKKLNDAIHALELENGTLKAEIERSVREKRSVESELEKVYKEGVQKAYEDGGRYDQLSKRACDAERERDEVKMKLCTTEAELKRTEMRMDNDKLKLQKDIDRLSERLSVLQKDFDEINSDRLRHLEAANAAEELANTVKRESEAASRKHNKEMMCMEHTLSLKQTEFESKLRTIEETHRKALNKLREDVTSQQRSTNQWKDEYHLLSEKWEQTVQSLRAELSGKESRINELTSMLREAKDKTFDAENMIKDYTNQMRKIEYRTKEAERRAAEAMTQNANKDRKIRQLLMERQHIVNKHDALINEGTFRMSDMFNEGLAAGDALGLSARSAHVLGELSLNRSGENNRPRSRLSAKDLLDNDDLGL